MSDTKHVKSRGRSDPEAERLRKHNEELREELARKHAEVEQLSTDVHKLKEHVYKSKTPNPKLVKILKITIPIIIPLIVIAYIIYMNAAPLENSYVLDVGSPGDTDNTKEIYLESTSSLGPTQGYGNKTFRELNGVTYVVFNPRAILSNNVINVSIEGENVFIVPPQIDLNYENYMWNMTADFSSVISQQWKSQSEKSLKNDSNESRTEVNASIKHTIGCGAYFDGKSKLYLPNTYDNFEDGLFTVYIEWTPKKSNESFQQIIGHFNWELLQNQDTVQFQVGRMNNSTGPFYQIYHNIDQTFFNKKHTAIATYNPSSNGYIELIIDGKFVDRIKIGEDTLWPDYNGAIDLSIGKSNHGAATYYEGCVGKIMITDNALNIYPRKIELEVEGEELSIPIINKGILDTVKITVQKKKK